MDYRYRFAIIDWEGRVIASFQHRSHAEKTWAVLQSKHPENGYSIVEADDE